VAGFSVSCDLSVRAAGKGLRRKRGERFAGEVDCEENMRKGSMGLARR